MEEATKADKDLGCKASAKSGVVERAAEIIRRHFDAAIADKEEELEAVHKAIVETQEVLRLLRYAAVTKAFSKSACNDVSHTVLNTGSLSGYSEPLHPQVQAMVKGKAPTAGARTASSGQPRMLTNFDVIRGADDREETPSFKEDKQALGLEASRTCVRREKVRIVVGNASKWIECDQRGEDRSTHKWTLYVRGGDKDRPDVSDVVAKVRFFLHPSYHPNDVVDVTSPPFHLVRRGWAEFPARVQIHFRNQRLLGQDSIRPVDIVHCIKLDKTYTGLQTLGAETVVDVSLSRPVRLESPSESSLSEASTPKSEPVQDEYPPAKKARRYGSAKVAKRSDKKSVEPPRRPPMPGESLLKKGGGSQRSISKVSPGNMKAVI